ncbi:MAG: histidine kinase [Burkholderiaceae bacterium]
MGEGQELSKITAMQWLFRVADALANWSWWKLLAVSLLILIAGAMLDDYLVPPVKRVHKVVEFKAESKTNRPDTSDSSEEKGPSNEQAPQAKVLQEKASQGNATQEKAPQEKAPQEKTPQEKPAESAPSGATSKASANDRMPKDSGSRIQISIDTNGIHVDSSDPKIREGFHEAIRELTEAMAQAKRDAAEARREVEDLRKEVRLQGDPQAKRFDDEPSWGEGMGWREEPFVGLSRLIVVSLFILKVLGSSRRRELDAKALASQALAGREAAQLKQDLAEARLRQMQTQIEPHFLFNTLAALQQLIASDPEKAAAMNRHLIDWLRTGLKLMRQERSRLEDEAVLLSEYLHLMKIRMEERLTWSINFPPSLREIKVPSLLLQPLVENAISHGLEPMPQGGMIRIEATRRGNELELSVHDNGIGFKHQQDPHPLGDGPSNPDTWRQTDRDGMVHMGLGLDNVRSRLRLLFGAQARLTVSAHEVGGTSVKISLPLPPLA